MTEPAESSQHNGEHAKWTTTHTITGQEMQTTQTTQADETAYLTDSQPWERPKADETAYLTDSQPWERPKTQAQLLVKSK
jgi:hypothetical protein